MLFGKKKNVKPSFEFMKTILMQIMRKGKYSKFIILDIRMKLFGEAEKRILSYFQKGSKIIFKGQEFSILEADKPTCLHGEPKTDIYVLPFYNQLKEQMRL